MDFSRTRAVCVGGLRASYGSGSWPTTVVRKMALVERGAIEQSMVCLYEWEMSGVITGL